MRSIETGTDQLLASADNGVAWLTRNSGCVEFIDYGTLQCFRKVACRVRAGSSGQGFCAGGDFNDMAETGSPEKPMNELAH